jgi:hypothetical protein
MDSKPEEDKEDKDQVAEKNNNDADSNDEDFKSCEDQDEI